jgi:hypothetical protein
VRSYFERDGKFTFIQTHLIGCVKEKNTLILGELIHIVTNPPTGLAFTPDELNNIIHFKKDAGENSIFGKTALTWAMENDNEFMAIELLKLEKEFHKTEREGLKCLRDNLSSPEQDKFRPWIFKTYSSFFVTPPHWIVVFYAIFIRIMKTCGSYYFDIYSDVILAISYGKFSIGNYSVTELWTCGDTKLNSSCYEIIGPDNAVIYNHTEGDYQSLYFAELQSMFSLAFWVTIILISWSIIFYIGCIFFDSSPEWLEISWLGTRKGTGKGKGLLHVFVLKALLTCVWIPFFPLIYCVQRQLYLTYRKDKYKENIDKNTVVWNNIRTLELGLEASIQCFLQLWLLRPFLPIIMTWNTAELISRCVTGFGHFFTLEIHPACHIERAFVKILLTVLHLSYSISHTKKKPGQDLKKTLLKAVSILAQTVARIVALISLVLMKTSLGHYKYALFFVLHCGLVFLIKVLFEVKSLRHKIGACCKSKDREKAFWKTMKFITSGFSSTIVMIHMNRDKKHPLFLSQCAFQGLILVENLLLVFLPYIENGIFYPPDDCFPANRWVYAVWFVIVAWFFGVQFQGLHYKTSSPVSKLNGPEVFRCWPPKMSFLATLCWKRKTQRIELDGFSQLECTDDNG